MKSHLSEDKHANQKKTKIEPPIYDGKESIPSYTRRIEAYKASIKFEKYDIILDFINEWLNQEKKLTSLSDFKNVSEKLLLKDPKHNRDLLRKHSNNLIKNFNVNSSIEDDTDSDDINDSYIIYFVTKILNYFGYSMIAKIMNETKYYTIKMKS